MSAAVSAEGVARRYGAVTALRPTTLAVASGETAVVLGPSGCGKSTLLRILVGLVRPDAGSVALFGEPMGPSTARRLRHRTGYVIQEGGLFPHLTAAGNAALLARHLGWPDDRVAARIEALGAMLRLPPDVWGRRPGRLSGGQRQRVALARALFLDPDLLLLDEPLGALDPITRYDLQQELRALFAELGKAVVLVTHDLAEAAFFSERVILMEAGAVVQEGALADLAERPATPFVRRFVTAQRAAYV